MSNKAFQQNLDDKKGPQPGGPYLIQMLFKEPVEMPDKEKMTAVMEKHIGSTECFCYDKKMAGFAALDHVAEFQDGKCPVQLMVMKCDKFKGKGFDAFLMSQMWDCQEDRERIFRECKYQVVATDMLAAALPALERAGRGHIHVDRVAQIVARLPTAIDNAELVVRKPVVDADKGSDRCGVCAHFLGSRWPVKLNWPSGKR